MPRVHQGIIRRRHGANTTGRGGRGGGGIFSLSTPFRDAASASARGGANNNMLLLASVAGMDHGVRDDDAEISAVDDGDGPGERRRRFGDGMEDGDDSDDATVLDDGIDRDGGRKDVEDDGDDGGSVDLLSADEGENDESEAVAVDRSGGNDDGDDNSMRKRTKRRHRREHLRGRRLAKASKLTSTSTSPATQTLDRLSVFGSQEGGAELCIHLLVDDAAEGTNAAAVAAATSSGREDNVGKGNDDEKSEEDGHHDVEVVKAAASADGEERGNSTKRCGGTAGAATSTAAAVATDRKDDDNYYDDIMGKRQRCLRSLKAYFMSTKNSSDYAMQLQRQRAKRNHSGGSGTVLPPTLAVPFCHRCKHSSSAYTATSTMADASSHVPPHHGLCPHHADFYGSGSYEILNLIVDGNLLSCEACMYQFDHGRLNKALCHIDGCERRKRSGKDDGKGNSKNSNNGGIIRAGRYADGKELYDKKEKKEKESNDYDEIGKKYTGGGIGGGHQPTTPSPTASRGMRSRCRPKAREGNSPTKTNTTRCSSVAASASVSSSLWACHRCGRANDPARKRCSSCMGWRGGSREGSSSQLTPPRAAVMHGQTKEKANSVSKMSINQGSQSLVENRRMLFEVGTIVFVQDRTWPGRNDLGGVARIVKVHQPNNEDDDDGDGDDRATYDVKYVLETRREKYVEEEFLSLQTEYVSPSKKGQGSGFVEIENNGDSSTQASAAVNEDDTTAIDTIEAATAGVGADGNRAAAVTLDSNNATSSPDHVDADGHPLSEYERLRLRNMQRNKSRLAQLGLLVPPVKTNYGGQSLSSSSGTTGKKRKARHQPLGDEVERRTQPKRQTAAKRPEGDGKPKASTSASTATAADAGKEKDKVGKESLNIVGESREDYLDQRQLQLKTAMEVEDGHTKQNKPTETAHGAGNAVVASLPILIHNQPTPSPIPPRRKKDITPQQRPPPRLTPLPSWINEFILESNRHNETVPAPRGSKWIPCPNPWGKIGHLDGDFVIISPFQSETAHDILSIFHQGLNGSGMPRRFVANPLEEGSPYHATHRSPARGGYSVLRLQRDRTSLRPWGFTVRLHEFGGACLVESVEPLSPAEAAEDISGWTDESSSSALKLHDMIICINGKSIGSLTMTELLIELDVCGPDMMLVVSRFDIQGTDANRELTTLEDLAMDWNDIGAGATLERNRVSFEDDCNSGDHSELEDQPDAQGDEKYDSQTYGAESEFSIPRVDNTHASVKTGPQPALARDENSDTPMRLPVPTRHASLSEAAESGCRKCNLELKTGIKGSQAHCPSCPRKKKQRFSKRDNIHECTQPCEIGKKHVGDSSGSKKTCQNRPHYSSSVDDAAMETEAPMKRNKINLPSKDSYDNDSSSSSTAEDECEGDDDENPSSVDDAAVESKAPMKRNKINLPSKDSYDNDSSSSSTAEDECEGDDDENPWLGCVCGKTHPHPIKVFWIQCESCDAWYNVAEECVGFDEHTAEKIDKWCCWACNPPVAGLGL